jgi:hypothetical protein
VLRHRQHITLSLSKSENRHTGRGKGKYWIYSRAEFFGFDRSSGWLKSRICVSVFRLRQASQRASTSQPSGFDSNFVGCAFSAPKCWLKFHFDPGIPSKWVGHYSSNLSSGAGHAAACPYVKPKVGQFRRVCFQRTKVLAEIPF